MRQVVASDGARAQAARPIRLGLVGLGLAGGVMATAVRSHPGFVLAGAVEPDTALRERFIAAENIRAWDSLEPLVDCDDIDAIYIASPHQFHRDQTILAASRGKHVLVEKPMALSLEDCDAMIAAADHHGVKLLVGHTHGFDPSLQVMRELMASGLGQPTTLVSLNYTDFLYRPRRPEELDTRLGGGIVFNQLPHQVDMVRALVRSPVRSVRATTSSLDPARPTEGGCSALLVFEGGASASLVYNGYDGFDSDELHGWISEGGYPKTPAHGGSRRKLESLADAADEQALRRDSYGYGSAIGQARPPHQPHFGFLVVTCRHGELRQSADGVTVYTRDGVRDIPMPSTPWRPGRGDALEALRKAITGEEASVHDGLFGRATLEVCLAILRSAREQREIHLGGAA